MIDVVGFHSTGRAEGARDQFFTCLGKSNVADMADARQAMTGLFAHGQFAQIGPPKVRVGQLSQVFSILFLLANCPVTAIDRNGVIYKRMNRVGKGKFCTGEGVLLPSLLFAGKQSEGHGQDLGKIWIVKPFHYKGAQWLQDNSSKKMLKIKFKKPNITNLTFGRPIWVNCPWANSPVTGHNIQWWEEYISKPTGQHDG